MTAPATDVEAEMKRLPVASGVTIAGALGLAVSMCLPQGEVLHVPVAFFTDPGAYAEEARWTTLVPFALAVLLLAFRLVDRSVRRRATGAILGWIAAAACFAGLVAMDLGLWKSFCENMGGRVRPEAEDLIGMGLLVTLAAASLATAALVAAPSRTRLAASCAIVGVPSAYLFAFLIWLVIHQRASNGAAESFGLVVSFCSSLLLVIGGTKETLILWRAGEAPEGKP